MVTDDHYTTPPEIPISEKTKMLTPQDFDSQFPTKDPTAPWPKQEPRKSPVSKIKDFAAWQVEALKLFNTLKGWKTALKSASLECNQFVKTVGGIESYNQKSREIFGFPLIDEESSELFEDFARQLQQWSVWMEEYQRRIYKEHKLDFKDDDPQMKLPFA